MSIQRLPRAGVPLSDLELVELLEATGEPDSVSVVVTAGVERVGRTVVVVSGTDDPLGVLDRLAGQGACAGGVELHALHAGELVSVSGPVDRGAVTVRSLLWSVVGFGSVVAFWAWFLADLIGRVASFGAGL